MCLRFEVFTTVKTLMLIFWVAKPCLGYRLGETCFQLQGWYIQSNRHRIATWSTKIDINVYSEKQRTEDSV